MRLRRIVAGAALAALAGATVIGTPTQAAEGGTANSGVTAELLSIDLGGGGSLLGVDLVGETASTRHGATPSASVRLSTAALSSALLSALNVTGPVVGADSTSSSQTVTAPAVDLSAPGGLALPEGVIAGRIVPAPLTASVDGSGARVSGGASIEGLSLAGGLVSAGTLATTIGSTSLGTEATAARTLRVEDLHVLDLGALLSGLGIDPATLPVDRLVGLVTTLGIDVVGIPAGETLVGTINELSTLIDALRSLVPTSSVSAQQLGGVTGVVDGVTGVVDEVTGVVDGITGVVDGVPVVGPVVDGVVDPVVDPVVDVVDGALGALPVPTVPLDQVVSLLPLPAPLADLVNELLGPTPTVQDVLDAITGLQEDLTSVIESTVGAIEDAPLLTLEGVEIDVAARATETVESSLSAISASIGAVRIGELTALAGVDLTDLSSATALAQLEALAQSIATEIGEVLSQVSPSLAGIVDIDLFTETETVRAVGSTVEALAAVTALTVTITPPADLAAIIAELETAIGVDDLLAGIGAVVPSIEGPMSQLNDLLAGVTAGEVSAQQAGPLGALAQGVTLRLGTLSATSAFTPAAASVPTPTGTAPAAPTAGPAPAAPAVPTGSAPEPAAPVELPRTGSSLTFVLLAAAMLLIVTGMGLPQWAEAAVTSRGSRHTN